MQQMLSLERVSAWELLVNSFTDSYERLILLRDIGMQHSGIGGGGFMLVRGSDGEYESIGTNSPGLLYENCY